MGSKTNASSSSSSSSSPVGRSFFKIMFGTNYKELMFIPPEFAQTIGFLKNRDVFLYCSSGHTWKVKISVVDGSMAFLEGWKDFVSNLSVGELVTFKYIGGHVFKAKVYATSACNRVNISKNNTDTSPCHIGHVPTKKNIDNGRKRPYTTLSIHDKTYFRKPKKTWEILEANGPSLQKPRWIESTSPILSGTGIHTGDHLDEKAKNITHVFKKAGYHMASKEPLNHKLYTANCSTSQKDSIKRKRGRPRKTEIGRPVNVKSSKISMVTPVIECRKYRTQKIKKVAGVSERQNEGWRQHRETVDDSLSRTHSASQNCSEAGMGNLKEPEEDVPDFLVTEDGICYNFERSLLHTIKSLKKNRNPPKNGTAMSLPLVHSSARFSVTLPAQSSWLVSKSSEPCNVLKPGTIFSAQAFGHRLRSHLGRMKMDRKVIILRDPSMKMWPVVYREKTKFVCFVGGWKDFATANDLRQGDICEFEDVNGTEAMFQVQVFR